MRSYEAARSYFSILEFLSWAVIAIGAIVALVGMAAGSQGGPFGGRSGGLAILGALPGLYFAFLGFLGLVVNQIGRAGVDSAEYGQQSLQIARDQLEISRQSLKLQGGSPVASFAATVKKDESNQSLQGNVASYADELAESVGASVHEPHEAPKRKTLGRTKSPFGYLGRQVRVDDGQYSYDGKSFETAEAVRAHIDAVSNGPRTKD